MSKFTYKSAPTPWCDRFQRVRWLSEIEVVSDHVEHLCSFLYKYTSPESNQWIQAKKRGIPFDLKCGARESSRRQ